MTLSQAVREAQEQLAAMGGDAATDARTFACKVMGIAYKDYLLHGQDPVDEQGIQAIQTMVFRRLSGEPAQYIVGTADFLGTELLCDERALIPRFETELLVQEAIEQAQLHGYSQGLDLCTGSGCIAVMLAREGLQMDACDISAQALSLARENAQHLGVDVNFYQGDLFAALPGGASYDLIVSNPPYIPAGEITSLQREVAGYEPANALDGGEDGLHFYRQIATQAPKYLRAGGMLLMEMGRGQEEAIEALLRESFYEITILPDLRGIHRMIRGMRRDKG